MKNRIPIICTLASVMFLPISSSATLIVEELFAHPQYTGIAQVDTAGIASWAITQGGTGSNVDSGNIGYMDTATNTLVTGGNKFFAPFGTYSGSPDYAAWGSLASGSKIGADGSGADGQSLYIAFQFENAPIDDHIGINLEDTTAPHSWGIQGLLAGGLAGAGNRIGLVSNWGSANLVEAATNAGSAYLLVLKIDYQSGLDTASLWVNPADLSDPGTADAVTTGNFTFNRINLIGRGMTRYDNVRIGTTLQDVIPFDAGSGGGGGGGDTSLVLEELFDEQQYTNIALVQSHGVASWAITQGGTGSNVDSGDVGYISGTSQTLTTGGNKFFAPFGMYSATPDTVAWGNLMNAGKIGVDGGSADGQTLYVAFQFQNAPVDDHIGLNFEDTTANHEWGLQGLLVGGLAGAGNRIGIVSNWGSANLVEAATNNGSSYLVVVRIDYQFGLDTASVWVNPNDLEILGTPSATTTGNFAFNRINMVGRGMTRYDNLRMGTDLADVIPFTSTGGGGGGGEDGLFMVELFEEVPYTNITAVETPGINQWAITQGGTGSNVDTGDIPYTDQSDRKVDSGWNKFFAPFGMYSATPDFSAWGSFTNGSKIGADMSGADGKSLFISFMLSNAPLNDHFGLNFEDTTATHSFGLQGLLIGGIYGGGGQLGVVSNWGAASITGTGTYTGGDYFIVAEIQYANGLDTVRIWVNPADLTNLGAPAATTTGNFAFNRINLVGRGMIRYDNIRIASELTEVLPFDGTSYEPDDVFETEIQVLYQKPVIDGAIDSAWDLVPSVNIGKDIIEETSPTSAADLSASYKLMSDGNELFLLVEVIDDVVANYDENDADGIQWWMDDSIEIYIDGDQSRSDSYDGVNDAQISIRAIDPDNKVYYGPNSVTGLAIRSASALTGNGYVIEMALPLGDLEMGGYHNQTIGFDIAVNDGDLNQGAWPPVRLGWYDESGQAHNQTLNFGKATFIIPFVELVNGEHMQSDSYTSEWLGGFQMMPAGWVMHSGLGRFWPEWTSTSELIIWSNATGGWLYTTEAWFPVLYNCEDLTWNFYMMVEGNGYLYNYNDANWEWLPAAM